MFSVMLLALLTGLLWLTPLPSHAGAIHLAWDCLDCVGYSHMQLRRCTATTPTGICPPTALLPAGKLLGTARTFTDATAVPGVRYCYTVSQTLTGYPDSAASNVSCGTAPVVLTGAPTDLREGVAPAGILQEPPRAAKKRR